MIFFTIGENLNSEEIKKRTGKRKRQMLGDNSGLVLHALGPMKE